MPGCSADCDGDGVVESADLVIFTELTLGRGAGHVCGRFSATPGARPNLENLIDAVAQGLGSCAPSP
jgi:hypothetical protein